LRTVEIRLKLDVNVRTTQGEARVGHAAAIETAGESRPPRWLLGGRVGLQVWAATLDSLIWATLLIETRGRVGPILLLNAGLVETAHEGAAISWAMALLDACEPGFYVLRAGL
jgi:hypothetical protein